MTPAFATYVYCLVVSARKPLLARVPAGVPGAGRVRLLEVTNADRGRTSASAPRRASSSRLSETRSTRWLVVADVPLARYNEAAIARGLSNLEWVSRAAVAHEAVVEAFVGATAVLPMKLFTIFSSDDRALAYVEGERRRIDRLVKRVAGRYEWGVRLTLHQGPASPTRVAAFPAQRTTIEDGIRYLAHKKAQRDAIAERATRARETAADLYGELTPLSSEARRRGASELPVQGGPLLLDAVFLVPVGREAKFRRLVENRTRSLAASGYHVALSGPWPPYGFVQD